MTNSCCVEGCRNVEVGANSGILFYKFPDNVALKKRWMEAIGRKDWKPTSSSVICSGHFVSGQRHSQEWHPDYVPSVFRNIRRTIKIPKWRQDDIEVEAPSPRLIKGSSEKSTPVSSKSKSVSSKSVSVTVQSTSISEKSKSVSVKSTSTSAKSTSASSKSTYSSKSTPSSSKSTPTSSKSSPASSKTTPASSSKTSSSKTPTSKASQGLSKSKLASSKPSAAWAKIKATPAPAPIIYPPPMPKYTPILARKSIAVKATPILTKDSPVLENSTSDLEESPPALEKSNVRVSLASNDRISPFSKIRPGTGIDRSALITPTRNTKVRGGTEQTVEIGTKRIRKKKVISSPSDDRKIRIPVKLGSEGPKKVNISRVEGNKTSGLKRKEMEPEYEVMPILKNLSIVLERTSEEKIKSSTMGNDIEIKEEPESDNEDNDYAVPEISTKVPSPYKRRRLSDDIEKKEEEEEEDEEEEEEEHAPEEFEDEDPEDPDFECDTPINECMNCNSLKLKLNRLEINMKKAASGKCKQCGVLRNKLSAAESVRSELGGRCSRCITSEAKNKRLENQLKKLQTELAESHNKLAAIEISEQAFKKYKSKVKMYTGLPNYETLAVIFDHLKGHFPSTGVKALSSFQMFVLVLMRAKLNLPFWDLTYRFGAPPNTIQQFYSKFIEIIEVQLSHVILWPKANLHYRLQVLASNLKQSYGIIKTTVDVDTLLVPSSPLMEEDDKVTRVCAALYHISQLVSSNHSQQLVRILRSRDDTDRSSLAKTGGSDETKGNGIEMDEEFDEETRAKIAEGLLVNGEVNDSDIFFEDLSKETGSNSNDSLSLECRNLKKDIMALTNKLDVQFRFYTGIRSYDVFNNLLSFFKSHVLHISIEKLTYFQQLHLVLMRLKLNLEVQDLAYIFGVDQDHIVYITRQWVDVIIRHLSRYIDWPAGIEDDDGEKKLLGTVKLKYQILSSPRISPRNKSTGREKEKVDMKKWIRACAAIYNIDDIEVFKNGEKKMNPAGCDLLTDGASNEELEKKCQDLRVELYKLRRSTILHYTSSIYTEENLKGDNQMVKFCTGFFSFESLASIFKIIVPTSKEESRKLLSPFQQFIAVLLRLKLNLSITDIGHRFGMCPTNVHKLLQDWLLILHEKLSPYITWPDDDEDVEVFTDVLRKTYGYLRAISPNRKSQGRRLDTGQYDITTLVCAGLFNAGEVTYAEISDTEFDSFDDDW